MDLDDIKAQLDRIFAAGNRSASREQADGLRQALVEFKIGIGQLREAVAQSERELQVVRREADDYQRRAGLAGRIGDAETVRVAEEFTAKAHERVDLLERKLLVQRDELAMAERDYQVTRERFQQASRGLPLDDAAAASPSAAADAHQFDQRDRDAVVEAQLAHLKKKLGETK